MKIRHHYIPAHHLRRFADSEGLVWVHDRDARFEPRRDVPENIAYEKFLYAPGEGAEDPRSQDFEDWLAEHFDGPAAGAITRIVQTGRAELSNPERSRLAGYIAAQDLRTPRTRDSILKVFQTAIDRRKPAMVAEALRATGVEPTSELVEELCAAYEARVNKSAWLQFVGDQVDRGAERLHGKAWCTISAPAGHQFLMNDIGVVKCAGGFNVVCSYRIGWTPPITHWLLPLSSQLALGLSPDRGFGYMTATPEFVDAVNERIALDARTYLFSASRQDVAKWWGSGGSSRAI